MADFGGCVPALKCLPTPCGRAGEHWRIGASRACRNRSFRKRRFQGALSLVGSADRNLFGVFSSRSWHDVFFVRTHRPSSHAVETYLKYLRPFCWD